METGKQGKEGQKYTRKIYREKKRGGTIFSGKSEIYEEKYEEKKKGGIIFVSLPVKEGKMSSVAEGKIIITIRRDRMVSEENEKL